jgi:hypothetical protein
MAAIVFDAKLDFISGGRMEFVLERMDYFMTR